MDGDSGADKTIVINGNDPSITVSESGDVTILLSQEAPVPPETTGTGLRNADAEIKHIISGSGSSSVAATPVDQLSLCDIRQLYVTGSLLGSGGQGIVHSGSDPALGRAVAIKSLRKELQQNAQSREEFIREARLTAMLDHPAILPVYNLCGTGDGDLHLAMKVLHGISFKDYLAKTSERYAAGNIKNFDEDNALINRLNIFIKVCEAMAYVHSKNIIHCDLKPENIMLGQYGEVYIIDWGIAREYGDTAAVPQKVMGTPRYIAPENLLHQPCDHRSDIYSLGVILFELVTLNQAFSGDSAADVIAKVKTGKFNALRHRFSHRIHPDLAAVISKATAHDVNSRYATTEALTADLRRYLRGAEVSANPDTGVRKVIRWIKRNRRKAAAAAAAALVILATFSMLGIFAANMRAAENEHLRDNTIDLAMAEAVQNAVTIDRTLNHIATLLGVLNADLAMLLDLNRNVSTLGNPEILPGSSTSANCTEDNCFTPENTPENHFIPGKPLDLFRATYHHPGSAAPAKSVHILRCLRPAVSRMRRTVLKSNPELPNASSADLIKAYRELKLPVSFCYFTLTNGLHIVYPGNNEVKAGFDGRTRPWFKKVKGKGAVPVWTLPYLNAFKQETPVISCSMEIIGAREKLHGVSGVDIPLPVIENMLMKSPGKAAYIKERMLLSPDGKVIAAVTGTAGTFKVDNQLKRDSILNRKNLKLIQSSRYGRFLRTKNGKEELVVYSTVASAQWIYIEKIDLKKLLFFSRVYRQ